MKVFFNAYSYNKIHCMLYDAHLCESSSYSGYKNFLMPNDVTNAIVNRLKDLFQDTIDIDYKQYDNGCTLTVQLKNQEDIDYFTLLTSCGMDI